MKLVGKEVDVANAREVLRVVDAAYGFDLEGSDVEWWLREILDPTSDMTQAMYGAWNIGIMSGVHENSRNGR